MKDYQELYLTMVRQTEKAIRILIEAQRTCEELYLAAEEPPILSLLHKKEDDS